MNENPVASATNSGPVFVGDDLQLFSLPDNMAEYAWIGPNSFTSVEQNPIIEDVTIDAGGQYEITLLDDNGCEGTATTDVVVNPLPEFTITFAVSDAINSNAIENASISINSENLITDANGEAQINLQNGDYPYTISAVGYLDFSATLTVSGINATEIVSLTPDGMQNIDASTLKIYPNPSKGILFIEVSEKMEAFTASLYDTYSKLVLHKDFKANDETSLKINLQGLENGVYYLKIYTNNMVYTEKIVLE